MLTTDAKGFKVFTRYDILSRPIVSGKYKGTASPAGTNPLFETPNTTAPHYYTSTSFPTDNNLDVYKVFYYDDYDIDNNGSLSAAESYTDPAESGYETAAFLRTRGKPTASKTGILKNDGTAPTVFLTTRTYYDKEYSVIQVNRQNHLSGADISSSAYDFANRVTKTRRDHTGTPPGGSQKTYYIREEYTYDEAGRLRFTRHHVKTTAGAPTSGWVVTAAPVYDELNRLADKRLHASNYNGIDSVALGASFNYLQSLDYTYNIRGWLTGINNPASCALQGGDQLADLFNLGLDYESTANGATAQFNGNIAAMQWRSNVNGSCLTRQQYRFTYDYANRLLTANHFTHNGTAWVNTNNYSESNITYDFNGNIKTYTRRGLTAPATFGIIDQLTYTYGDAARPDRLTNVSDAGSAAKGFKFTSGAAAYVYDLNGNLTQDNHKSLSFQYNYLNLPNYITNPGGSEITITYTADGEKLSKTSPTETRNYVSGIEYLGNALDAIYHGEGRCTPNGATAFYYEYTIKDHLGNARINFRANGAAVTFLQELHYYPFGMLMEGIGTAQVTNNGYKYNGKELNEDLGLNLHDYGARWYDASLGRWWSVDPMGDFQSNHSTYSYVYNNPMVFIDPTGMIGEGADGMTNDQWIAESRKDGGYWANAERLAHIDKTQLIKDFEGRSHMINEDDTNAGELVPYGTRYYVNGKLVLDRLEGYHVVCGGPGDPPDQKKDLKHLGIMFDAADIGLGLHGHMFVAGEVITHSEYLDRLSIYYLHSPAVPSARPRLLSTFGLVAKWSFYGGVFGTIGNSFLKIQLGEPYAPVLFKSTMDIGSGALSYFGGLNPYTLALSSGYFIVDKTVGWEKALKNNLNFLRTTRSQGDFLSMKFH